MIDESTFELLSRHLDDDLDETEVRALEIRLQGDPELRSELEAMAGLRSAVGELAAHEEPPAALDALVKPLRRSRAQVPRVRPALRWLATAATVLLGATVALEVARHERGPDPRPETVPRPTSSGEPFQLQPLPTRSGPEKDELLGAADHLLASPVPDVEAAPPEPLEVIGPLEEDQRSSSGEQKRGLAPVPEQPRPKVVQESAAAQSAAKREKEGLSHWRAAKAAPAAAPTRRILEPTPAQEVVAVEGSLDRARAELDSSVGRSVRRYVLRIRTAGGFVETTFSPAEGLGGGIYPVEVEVVSGRVVASRALADAASAEHERVADLLVGTAVKGAGDGVFSADAIVGE